MRKEEDVTIIISDIHLGTPQCNKEDFLAFVRALHRDPPDELVIAGDLLDFWRKTNSDVLLDNAEVLNLLFSLPCKIVYVVGNHDFLIGEIAASCGGKFGKVRFHKGYWFQSGDKDVFITHGYDIDVQATMEGLGIEAYEAFAAAQCRANNVVGGIASVLWDIVTGARKAARILFALGKHTEEEYDDVYKVAYSGAAHLLCGAQPDDLLVFGHTHWPSINKAGTIANTGSWCTEDGIERHNSYVKITGGKMELKYFDVAQKI